MTRPPSLSPLLRATLLAACVVSLLSFGVRAAFGLFTQPLSQDLALPREVYATALALQNLAWGAVQPLAGFFADRHGARRVMLAGGLCYAAGIVGMAYATTPAALYLTAGLLVGVGMGGASFTTAVAALGRAMPESHRAWAMGLGTAAGSLGQFVVVPLVQALADAGGWRSGAWAMAAALILAAFAALLVQGDRPSAPSPGAVRVPAAQVLRVAFAHRSYALLIAGFFVCGFQLAFITAHFPAYLGDRGLPAATGSWALALVGLFNVAGAYLAGAWAGRHSRKALLAAVYLARAVAIVLFLLVPPTTVSVLAFGAAMGLLWLSTVPLTSALVATFFGTRYMATLFGFVFLSHQVGSFLGVYLGGVLFARTGSYDVVWWLCIALSLFAAAVNLPIAERASQRFARLAAA